MIALNKLKNFLKKEGIPSYRANQVFQAVYKEGKSNYDDIHVLPKYVKKTLKDNIPILSFKILSEQKSKDSSAIKSLVVFKDSASVEIVLLRFKDGRNTVCVSSQVGCNLNCAFCATGKAGFKRNLTTEEIIDQVLYFQKKLIKSDERVDHIVFMGMGEPFNNYNHIKEAIDFFHNPVTFNISKRNITVSTAGVVDGIEKIINDQPTVNLAISLHAPTQKLREKLMPIAKIYTINELIKACDKYSQKTHRRITYEYIMINDVNDTDENAHNLANLLRGKLCHVNLIQYNKVKNLRFKPSTAKRIEAFKKILEINQIPVTLRVSLGSDIKGACGQLAGEDKIAVNVKKRN